MGQQAISSIPLTTVGHWARQRAQLRCPALPRRALPLCRVAEDPVVRLIRNLRQQGQVVAPEALGLAPLAAVCLVKSTEAGAVAHAIDRLVWPDGRLNRPEADFMDRTLLGLGAHSWLRSKEVGDVITTPA